VVDWRSGVAATVHPSVAVSRPQTRLLPKTDLAHIWPRIPSDLRDIGDIDGIYGSDIVDPQTNSLEGRGHMVYSTMAAVGGRLGPPLIPSLSTTSSASRLRSSAFHTVLLELEISLFPREFGTGTSSRVCLLDCERSSVEAHGDSERLFGCTIQSGGGSAVPFTCFIVRATQIFICLRS
jgi:hypothetical protein